MVEIGAFDAKTHFSEIIQKVRQGVEYLVTKNGKPVAKIVRPEMDADKVKESISATLALRKKYKMSQKQIKKLIQEGRKY